MLPEEPEYCRVRDSLERQTFNGTWDSLSIGCGVEIDSNPIRPTDHFHVDPIVSFGIHFKPP